MIIPGFRTSVSFVILAQSTRQTQHWAGPSKPSSPTAPRSKQQPPAKRTPLLWGSADIPQIPPPPAPPWLSHKKILTLQVAITTAPSPNHTRPISGPTPSTSTTAQSTRSFALHPSGPVLSPRPTDLPGRKGTLEGSFCSPKGAS